MGDRRFAAGVAVLYLAGLAVLVTSPWGWELNRLTVELYVTFRRVVPIAPGWVLPEHYGVLLNILLFVPLGALASVLTSRAWGWIMLASCATSSVIEVAQWQWLERDGAVSDVVANTVGGLTGVVLVTLAQRAPHAPAPRGGRSRRS